MDTLFLRMPAATGQPWQLLLRTEQGAVTVLEDCADEAALHQAAVAHANARVIALAPGTDVFMTSVVISARQLKQVGASVAYLIEEQVGQDIESLHVVQASQQADGSVPLLAVSEVRMQEWVSQAKAAGFRLEAVIPELMLLPLARMPGINLQDARWSLGLFGSQACLRTGPFSGATLETQALASMLDAAVNELAVTGTLHLQIYGNAEACRDTLLQWADARTANGLPTEIEWLEQDLPQLLQSADIAALLRTPFNLMQGDHARRGMIGLSPAWKWAAVFVVAAFTVQLLSEWLQYAHYKTRTKTTQTAAVQLYKQIFPQDRSVSSGNLRRRMEAQLQGGNESAGFLPMLTRLGDSLKSSGLQPQSLDFDASLRKLTLDVMAPGLGQLEQLKQQLEGQGLAAEILSANAQGSGVRGRLKITAGDA